MDIIYLIVVTLSCSSMSWVPLASVFEAALEQGLIRSKAEMTINDWVSLGIMCVDGGMVSFRIQPII